MLQQLGRANGLHLSWTLADCPSVTPPIYPSCCGSYDQALFHAGCRQDAGYGGFREDRMQVPVQIDLHGCEMSPGMQDNIEEKLRELESRFGRITAGRVVVKPPSGHHSTGGFYEVGIHLVLPEGRTVDVKRSPTADERLGNLPFAINEAFRRARRQLQDEARRLDRRVKQHGEQPIARVVRIDPSGEFGFLETSDGSEIYFHRNSVINGGFPRLKEGTRVMFVEEAGERGPQASTVKLLGKHGMRP
jgi:cold shock CspA family protein/ribosome-associated translation inhibitor RaiA